VRGRQRRVVLWPKVDPPHEEIRHGLTR
jgi:hypothetical protein